MCMSYACANYDVQHHRRVISHTLLSFYIILSFRNTVQMLVVDYVLEVSWKMVVLPSWVVTLIQQMFGPLLKLNP